jgi:formylglycine-generating enzyme required for sulfatase activity
MGSWDNEVGREMMKGQFIESKLNDFLLGRYEVTQKIWKAVAALPKVKVEMNPYPSRFKGMRLSGESVSWDEVKEFIGRLNQKLGLDESRGYRLPSEAEWEYAEQYVTERVD